METKLCLCSPEIVNVVIMGEICTSVEGPLNAPLHHLSATYLLIFHGAIKVLSKHWFSSMQQPGSCTAWQGPTKVWDHPAHLDVSDRTRSETQEVTTSWPVLFLTPTKTWQARNDIFSPENEIEMHLQSCPWSLALQCFVP